MIDKSLIRQCIRRDRTSMNRCYELCAPYVYSIIKSYINDESSRKDVLQNTFVQIFQSLRKFRSDKGAFKNWIATITTRSCLKHLRQNKKLALFIPYEDAEPIEYTEDMESKLSNLKALEIQYLLRDMPTGYKVVFMMSVIDGYTHTEIGKELGITPQTSRSQLSRAIKWVKKNILEETKSYIYGF